MREYAKVSPRFWIGPTGKTIRALGADCQVVALYLMTSPHANMLGLYHLPIPYLCADTGLSQQGASKALARLSEAGFCSYDEASEVVWVHEMARYQIGGSLKVNDKQCEGVRREYKCLPNNKFLQAFADRYGAQYHIVEARSFEAPSMTLRSKEQEQEQEKEQEITTLSGKPDVTKPELWNFKEPPTHGQESRYVLAFLNRCTGKRYQDVPANLEFISARLKEADVKTIKRVIAMKCDEWHDDERMAQFLRPATLFNRTNFAQYVGQLPQEAA